MASVRQAIVDYVVLQLGNVTTDNGYNIEVGEDRISRQAEDPSMLPTPAVIVIQGEEKVLKNYSNLYECELELVIGFVDIYSGDDPDSHANLFMADIQKAMGWEFEVNTTSYGTDNSTTTTVQLIEEGSLTNVTSAMPGYVIGQVTYGATYRRHMLDPNKV